MTVSTQKIASVSISVGTAGIDAASYDVPAIIAYHTQFPERARVYSSLTGLLDDGFTVGDPVYLAATKIKAQQPSPPNFVVGRRALAQTQTVRIVPTNTTTGWVHKITIQTPAGTTVSASHTVTTGQTVAQIVAALKTAVDALSLGITTTNGTTHLDIATTAAGDLFGYQLTKGATFEDRTADPGIATDLAAIKAENNSWYTFVVDSTGAAEITAAATWASANKKILFVTSQDTNLTIFSTLKTANHDYVFSQYTEAGSLSFAAAATMAAELTKQPGYGNVHLASLKGLAVDVLSENQMTQLETARASHFVSVAGRASLLGGKMASGEWLDIIRFIDYLTTKISERCFIVLANNNAVGKLPYSDASVALFEAEIEAELNRHVPIAIAASPAPLATGLPVADVDAATKASRVYPFLEFSAALAGAINYVTINGKVTY